LQLGDAVRPTRYALDLTVDPAKETFSGVVEVDVDLKAASKLVWINSKGLSIDGATVSTRGRSEPASIVPGDDETIGLALAQPVGPGAAHLRLAFRGPANAVDTEGIFREKFGDDWYAFTQFEDTFARRAFPCFDEPEFKTPWQLTVHAPRAQVVVANTPVASTVDEPNDMKAVRFVETKPLPSYLVAFAVGPFDVVDAGTAGRNRTPLRIIAPRGRAADAKFAAETTPRLLELLEEYFDIPYPYEKLDQIAIPITYGFGAMENAGLITYEDGILLGKPESDTRSRQTSYAYVAAHEMAHQWFGDLVTMRWWDDLWLNEGFATWMEGKIVGAWNPEIEPRISEVWSTRRVMSVDSLVTTRKVRQPITSRDDIANAFDSITYQKGAAVLRMFESQLGPTAFRDGVRKYLRAHAWGNATTADFVAALAGAANTDLAAAFASFVDQPGVPVVIATLKCEPGKAPRLALEQRRYRPIGSKGAPAETWRIPIELRHPSGHELGGAQFVLLSKSFEVILGERGSCPEWVVVNSGATGYYHVLYKGDLLTRLIDHLDRLSVPERVALAGDMRALIRSGDLPAGEALRMVPRLLRDPNPNVRAAAVALHEDFGEKYVADDLVPNYSRFLETNYGEIARGLGWQARKSDDPGTLTLRSELVPLLAKEGGDTALLAEAKTLALRWLDDGASVSPDTAGYVLPIAAQSADAPFFERLLAEAQKTSDAQRRSILFSALGSIRDPALLERSFAITLADTFDTRESISILWSASEYRATRDLAYDFLKKHYDALTSRLPKDYAAQLVYAGASFCDAQHRADVEAFFKDRVASAPGGPRNLVQVLEGIDLCAAQRAANAASIAEALR